MFGRNSDFNILLATDLYKVTHWKQYPKGTQIVSSYLESRGGKFPSTVFFGLQYFIKRYLEGQVVTREKIDEAEAKLNACFGGAKYFNREGWEYILEKYDGKLPVSIRAVPEGSDIPTGNVLVVIENTDHKCWWLTNYLETMLVEVWYPITVATQSNYIRRKLKAQLDRTGSAAGLDFMLHDFGYRGVSSQESAGIGGAAHLLNFNGTDTVAGIELLREYYNPGDQLIGASIPASEHSTITSWGKERELDAMRNMLTSYPTGPVACVSDSYNIWRACTEYWGRELRMEVLGRDGVLVVRPDSGDPASVDVRCLALLGEALGCIENDKGFKVLNPKVRLIQGDGVNCESITEVLEAMQFDGWAAENIVFGSGGALLQKMDRDTQKFAFKCSAIRIDGEWRDVFKDPITDPGKRSKRGRLRLVDHGQGNFSTVSGEGEDLLQEVFRNGELLVDQNLSDIRARAREAADAERNG